MYSLLVLMVYIFNSKKIFECISVIFLIPILGKRKFFFQNMNESFSNDSVQTNVLVII
jgi:hypothetical protein